MDLLTGNIRRIFFKYLYASFGSAIIVSIYSIVDCAVVGQYEGANGVAALATVAPIWNLIYSIGLLFGIGGAVLMSIARGQKQKEKGNEIFTSALIGVSTAAVLVWLLLFFMEESLLQLFGADAILLPLAKSYLKSVKVVAPLFVFGQFLAAFLRNDNAPGRATKAVLAGGIFNVFGDYFFVFICDMGITGAGLATAMGQAISVVIMCTHFFGKTCRLRLRRPRDLVQNLRQIAETGFSTFFIDLAMGILSLMFNNQIMQYAGAAALSVYGVIINISTLVQCCAYGIGQAAQPLLSTNFGAGKKERVKEAYTFGLLTVAGVSLLWMFLTIAFPLPILSFFMKPSGEVLNIAAPIMRIYFLSFLLLPFNIFSTYYFQAVVEPKTAFVISVMRGMVVSGLLIYLLPKLLSGGALWYAMPITEALTFLGIVWNMKRSRN